MGACLVKQVQIKPLLSLEVQSQQQPRVEVCLAIKLLLLHPSLEDQNQKIRKNQNRLRLLYLAQILPQVPPCLEINQTIQNQLQDRSLEGQLQSPKEVLSLVELLLLQVDYLETLLLQVVYLETKMEVDPTMENSLSLQNHRVPSLVQGLLCLDRDLLVPTSSPRSQKVARRKKLTTLKTRDTQTRRTSHPPSSWARTSAATTPSPRKSKNRSTSSRLPRLQTASELSAKESAPSRSVSLERRRR